MEYLKDEIKFYSKTFQGEVFGNILVGGGTPSLLSLPQITKLCSLIFKTFLFNPNGFRTFECSPISVTRDKMRTLKQGGFNRISLGVQSLTEAVVKLTGRPQSNKVVFSAIETILEQKFDFVNIDLLAGLATETPASFCATVLTIARFMADRNSICNVSINIYYFQPQEHYLKNILKKSEKQYLKRRKLFETALYRIIPEMERLGYLALTDIYGIVFEKIGKNSMKRQKKMPPQYECISDRPRANVGLGKFSISHIHGLGDFYACDKGGARFNAGMPIYSLLRESRLFL
jgi:radical SAM superfamily enzyme YgiQ (UPF0313 family)